MAKWCKECKQRICSCCNDCHNPQCKASISHKFAEALARLRQMVEGMK